MAVTFPLGKLIYNYPPTIPPPPEDPTPFGARRAEQFGFSTLNGGTTGGLGGEEVTVTNYNDFKAVMQVDAPKIVKVSGTLNGSSSNQGFYCRGNKTVYGLPGSFCNGFGLWFDGATNAANGSPVTKNFIILNLKFDNMAGTTLRDYITIKEDVTNFFVAHNECTSTSSTDGLIDFGTACDYGTVMYNKLVGASRATLIGGSNRNPRDIGKLRGTYAYNWYLDNSARCPSYQTSTGLHFMNNFCEFVEKIGTSTSDYQSAARSGGVIYHNNNVYKNVNHPLTVIAGVDSNGNTVPYGIHLNHTSNRYISSGTLQLSNMTGTSTWNPSQNYSFSNLVLDLDDVEQHVKTYSGNTLTEAQCRSLAGLLAP